MTASRSPNKVQRVAERRWVPIALMRVSPSAQREFRQYRADKIVANFDPEMIGVPTVNKRSDGYFYIVDGQHRVGALRDMGWEDQQIECNVYHGLTEAEEAAMWTRLNDVLVVGALDRFNVSVVAGFDREVAIEKIVRDLGFAVRRGAPGDAAIMCPGTLVKVYDRAGATVLRRTIKVLRDSYGDIGMQASVIDGLSLVLARYGDQVDDDKTIETLIKVMGGLNGLVGLGQRLRVQLHQPLGQSIAAAIVEVLNRGRGGKKLSPWFSEA